MSDYEDSVEKIRKHGELLNDEDGEYWTFLAEATRYEHMMPEQLRKYLHLEIHAQASVIDEQFEIVEEKHEQTVINRHVKRKEQTDEPK